MKPPKRASRQVDKFRDRARKVIEHHLGGAKRITYLSSGLTNFVFSFSTSDGNFIIRISPDPARINAFMKEQWAVRAAREVDVPAPEILEVGLDLIEFPYMVTRATEGSEALHHPKKLDILHELGRHAAIINSIKTKGFGETFDWSENQLSFNGDLKGWLEKEYDYEAKIEVLTKNRMITDDRAKRIRKIFSEHSKSRKTPVLNHSDLRLKNVIADDDGRINAIIDWEGCISNVAPAWELSLALHDLGIDGAQTFLEGYGIKEKELREAMPLIRAFNIANYAGWVSGLAQQKDKKTLAQYRLRLQGELDLYSF